MKEKISHPKASALVNEIFAKQKFSFIEKQQPKTVGEYFKKNKEKCQKKFANT
jgi:hypothetical protein